MSVTDTILAITGPLQQTLGTLANNPNGSPDGKKQAEDNFRVVATFNATAATLAAALVVSNTPGLGNGSSGSTPSSKGD